MKNFLCTDLFERKLDTLNIFNIPVLDIMEIIPAKCLATNVVLYAASPFKTMLLGLHFMGSL